MEPLIDVGADLVKSAAPELEKAAAPAVEEIAGKVGIGATEAAGDIGKSAGRGALSRIAKLLKGGAKGLVNVGSLAASALSIGKNVIGSTAGQTVQNPGATSPSGERLGAATAPNSASGNDFRAPPIDVGDIGAPTPPGGGDFNNDDGDNGPGGGRNNSELRVIIKLLREILNVDRAAMKVNAAGFRSMGENIERIDVGLKTESSFNQMQSERQTASHFGMLRGLLGRVGGLAGGTAKEAGKGMLVAGGVGALLAVISSLLPKDKETTGPDGKKIKHYSQSFGARIGRGAMAAAGQLLSGGALLDPKGFVDEINMAEDDPAKLQKIKDRSHEYMHNRLGYAGGIIADNLPFNEMQRLSTLQSQDDKMAQSQAQIRAGKLNLFKSALSHGATFTEAEEISGGGQYSRWSSKQRNDALMAFTHSSHYKRGPSTSTSDSDVAGASTNDPKANRLLDAISQGESGGNYNAVFNTKNPRNKQKLAAILKQVGAKNISELTIGQLLALQPQFVRAFGSSASGKYQFIRKTLEELIAEMHIPLSTKFNAKTQDKLAMQLLKDDGYNKFKAGNMSAADFQNNIAETWASVKNTSGAGVYDNDGLNQSSASATSDVISALDSASPLSAQSSTDASIANIGNQNGQNQVASISSPTSSVINNQNVRNNSQINMQDMSATAPIDLANHTRPNVG